MLREPKLVRYPFGNYWWQEVNPHEYQICRSDPPQTLIGRLVEIMPHGRDKGKWILPDANQEYATSEMAVMGLELWHKLNIPPSAPVTPEPAPESVPVSPVEDTENWLSIKEFAKLTGLSYSTVSGRIDLGYLKAQKILDTAKKQYVWRVAPPALQEPNALRVRIPQRMLPAPVHPEPAPPAASPPSAPTPESESLPDPDTIGWLTVKDAAPRFGMSERNLRLQLEQGKIGPAIQIRTLQGPSWRIDPAIVPDPGPESIGMEDRQDLQRQLTDLRNTYHADMRDLNRDLGRLFSRVEAIEHTLIQAQTPHVVQPTTTQPFWKRLVSVPSNGQQEGGQDR